MEFEGETVRVPGPKLDSPQISLDLRGILRAESRQEEVAAVTPMKAPELLSLFATAWRDTDKLVNQLYAAKLMADKGVERWAAKMLLEDVPRVLKDKGISSTSDTRNAVILCDPTHQALQDVADQITAAREFLKGKLKNFENAFTSVKKIMGEDAYNMSTRTPNPHLSIGEHRSVSLGVTTTVKTTITTPPNPGKPAFGKPRYDKQ